MEKKNKEHKPADEALHAEEAKAKPEEKPTKPATFEGFVNAHGFIHLGKSLRKAFGSPKGEKTAISIELTAEGTLIIRKA